MTGFEYFWLNQIALGNTDVSKRNPYVLDLLRDGMIEHIDAAYFAPTEAGKEALENFLSENPTLPTDLRENAPGSLENSG